MIDQTHSLELPHGYRLSAQSEVVSTNLTCLEMANANAAGNLWVTAKQQTAGRGSRGRDWESGAGNLFASLLLDNPADISKVSTLTFVSSLAISDALKAVGVAPEKISLKWPNDVLLNGKKLSGILLESHSVKNRFFVIVGIGINIKQFPETALFKATSLAQEGLDTSSEIVFSALAHAFAKRMDEWRGGLGFEDIRADWLSQAANIGKTIIVKLNDEVHEGIFEDLKSDGRLVLLRDNGEREFISTADIFFR